MVVICISAGGGKTYLSNKFPDIFIDIDNIVWLPKHKYFHKFIVNALKEHDMSMLGNIYYKIITDSREELKKTNKIILVRDPINAEWLRLPCIGIIRPINSLFKTNIKSRYPIEKEIAFKNWTYLGTYNPYIIEFKTNSDLEYVISDILEAYNKNKYKQIQ